MHGFQGSFDHMILVSLEHITVNYSHSQISEVSLNPFNCAAILLHYLLG